MSWYDSVTPADTEKTNNRDIVISTKVKLMRNLSKYPFGKRFSASERSELIAFAVKTFSPLSLTTIDFAALDRTSMTAFAERGCVSFDFIRETLPHTLLLSTDEELSIAVGGKEHIEISAYRQGYALQEAFLAAGNAETLLDSTGEIAFDNSLGYLTADISKLGCAAKFSLLLFLPATTLADKAETVRRYAEKLHTVLRPYFDSVKKSDESGLYLLSHTASLGYSEQDSIAALEKAVVQISDIEHQERAKLQQDYYAFADRIGRAYGILSNSYRLSFTEFLTLWRDLRLGTAVGLSESETGTSDKKSAMERCFTQKLPSLEELDRIFIFAFPANLSKYANTETKMQSADSLRAVFLKSAWSRHENTSVRSS